MSLEGKLEKIRSPNLESQKQTAIVLSSVEDTLREQNTKFTSTAYFAALLAVLKQSVAQVTSNTPNELIVSTTYLLDLVISHVTPALLRTQFSDIVSLLAPSLSPENGSAPLLRSATGCLESLLIAQDAAAWNLSQSQTGPRQAVAALLPLAIDSRPKIRKRSQDALKLILQTPPPGPSIDHPAAELCAIAAQNNLKSAVQIVHQNRKHRDKTDGGHDPEVIHALQLTKTIAIASGGWPSKRIETLCETLLSLSRSRNEYLVMSAFEIFEVIFEGMRDEVSSAKLPRLLDAIIELKPAQNDSQLLPPWIAILSRGYGTFAEIESEEVFQKLPELFDTVSSFLTSPAHNIRVSASECLISFFANCIPTNTILDPSVYDEKILQKLADQGLSLLSVKYQTAWMEVFNALSALFDALRWRGDPYLLPIVQAIGELRSNEGFQGKKEADEVLGHAIRHLGPGSVLSILPLNLMAPQKGQPGRAWLLPLLRDHVSNTSLAHFKSDLIPLSEQMYQRVINHGTVEKTVETKIYETVVHQVWSTLPGYCDVPIDLEAAFDQEFAELISNVLYQQSDLRVDVCRGLQNLVESNQAVLGSDLDDETLQFARRIQRTDAKMNIKYLGKFASNILAVLFNVYSQTLPQSRAFILQCINSYLSITPENDLVETFDRVSKMLESELLAASANPSKKEPNQSSRNKMPPTSHTLLDLVIALSIYLPRSRFAALFNLASSILTSPAILKSDPQLIKKAYKLIPRLAGSDTGNQALKARHSELQSLMISTADTTPVPARRNRILAINTLISLLPSSELHFIPSVLGEIVLACKDTNEKARTAGFDCLISATEKIANAPSDTTIQNRLVSHMPDDATDAQASLEEVFTMVSAGLAGVAPHMVAASIIALGRLLFQYHEDHRLSSKVQEELVDTVTMFLQSNNREIVRGVLGFVKVMVVVLPLEMLEARMGSIVPGLLIWHKENKGRMRVKVKGILDRLIRRFGGAKVEHWVGPEARKLAVNLRKRRDRAKRKNKSTTDESDDDEVDDKKYDNEFDEAVYGSEDDDSEIEGSNDDQDAMSGVSFKTSKSGKSRRERDQFIRQDEDDDEPLDLLDPKSMAAISSTRRMGRLDNFKSNRKTTAKVNEDGKLIFGGNDDDGDVNVLGEEAAQGSREDGAINAYVDAVSGPDAVRRGQKGRLKVKSGIQKSARSDRNGGGDEMDLDVDEARKVAKAIMAGKGDSPRGKQPHQQRKGLGIEKHHGSSGEGVNKHRRKIGPNRKGVKFSSHPPRRNRR